MPSLFTFIGVFEIKSVTEALRMFYKIFFYAIQLPDQFMITRLFLIS